MAYALEAIGKEVRLVNADPAPEHYMDFPGVDRIEIARAVERTDAEALIVMESGDLTRTGVERPRGTLHRSTSITTRATRTTASSTGWTSRPRRAARWCST